MPTCAPALALPSVLCSGGLDMDEWGFDPEPSRPPPGPVPRGRAVAEGYEGGAGGSPGREWQPLPAQPQVRPPARGSRVM
jgi:hypothetical protein